MDPNRLHLMIFVILLAGFSCTVSGFAQGQPSGTPVATTVVSSSNLYEKLGDVETQLYGHSYYTQRISLRLKRVERTLFGAQYLATGTYEARFSQVQNKMKRHQQAQVEADQEPLLEYLEQKFFQRTFPTLPLTQRLHQLEEKVYGKSFDHYPTAVRLKKLMYTIPVLAKEVRLKHDGGNVIARASSKEYGVGTSALAASYPQEAEKPLMEKLLTPDDYHQRVYELAQNRRLRWVQLPVKVFVEDGNKDERAIISQAITEWNRVFPVKQVPQLADADVTVSWNRPLVPTQPTTDLMLHRDPQKHLRTSVLIRMTGYKASTFQEKLRGALHQLGHGLGIWGHSDCPDDVMFPRASKEYQDIPDTFRREISTLESRESWPESKVPPQQPSRRDKNTLIKLYDQPGEDLKGYLL